MDKKEKSVDAPGYDPNLKRVPFPPTPEDYRQAEKNLAEGLYAPKPEPEKVPYHENYPPEAPSPDPSQTMPGATDIRDPHARLAEDETTENMSPDVKLNLREPGSFDEG